MNEEEFINACGNEASAEADNWNEMQKTIVELKQENKQLKEEVERWQRDWKKHQQEDYDTQKELERYKDLIEVINQACDWRVAQILKEFEEAEQE